MKIICSRCDPPRVIGEKEPKGENRTTVGICDDCLAKYFPFMSIVATRLKIKEQDRYPDYKIKVKYMTGLERELIIAKEADKLWKLYQLRLRTLKERMGNE